MHKHNSYIERDDNTVYVAMPGTHELQNITISSPLPGEIKISGCFIRGSNAVGALVIVYSSRRVYYSFSTPLNQCVVVAKVSGLSRGHYQVSIFVVEEGGLPFNRSAIVPQNITIDQEGIYKSSLYSTVSPLYEIIPSLYMNPPYVCPADPWVPLIPLHCMWAS